MEGETEARAPHHCGAVHGKPCISGGKKPHVVLVLCSHERCSLASWLLHHQIPSSSPALKSGGVEGQRQGSE